MNVRAFLPANLPGLSMLQGKLGEVVNMKLEGAANLIAARESRSLDRMRVAYRAISLKLHAWLVEQVGEKWGKQERRHTRAARAAPIDINNGETRVT